MYKHIYVDQCGYLPDSKKRVTIRSEKPVPFFVRTTDGSFVYEGMADQRFENRSAGETDYVGEFSEVTGSGRYYIFAEGHGESDVFLIGEDAYRDVFRKSVDFFYLQRCGQKLSGAAGMFAHEACHTQIGRVYGSGEEKDVTGGWHDAGDYGRYVVPGAMAAAQLLYAYERNEKLCGDYRGPQEDGKACGNGVTEACGPKCPATEGNGRKMAALPDYLAEVKYELDWMLKMQREDGAVYHKATCKSFCGFIMPENEKEEMVISPVAVTATADLAAVCAMAVRFYQPYDAQYAQKLAEAAKKAYDAMKNMELPGGFQNPADLHTGEYGDPDDTDERYWAAAELYKALGDEKYRADFEVLAGEKIHHGYGWSNMGSYGNLAYLSGEHPVDETMKKAIRSEMIAMADRILDMVEKDGYGTALTDKMYVWGSNMVAANNGLHLFDAYQLTGDRKYLDAAGEQIHYLLGRNPMGICYMTGCGTNAVRHPHHRVSAFLGKAMPGMLSGGPCSWLADDTARELFAGTSAPAPAKCFVDMMGSHSTNEVTIYWNSPFVALLASVMQ